MISVKMMLSTGCMAPVITAQMVPTKIYGHSEMLKRITLKNDTGGTFSSCRKIIEKRVTRLRRRRDSGNMSSRDEGRS